VQNRWDEGEAAEVVAWCKDACQRDLALRVYTSRLIGQDPDLVLHGGGNCSVKTTVRDLLGDEVRVLRVKGSGWDMAEIEPAGLPAVRLAPLVRLRALDGLTDEQMVNQLRTQLLDASAPTPSVETLLHAFLPHTYVDHTHADAILILANQPDGEAVLREALGEDVVVLPWIMPGFPLAKAVAAAYEAHPDCHGIALGKHGLFTFGDDARTSYEQMIALVDRAERFVASRLAAPAALLCPQNGLPDEATAAGLCATVLPVVRGAVAIRDGASGSVTQRLVAEWRGAEDLRAFSAHPACRDVLAQGPLTPDHVIRTKGRYLVLGRDEAADPERCKQAVAAYAGSYTEYFEANRGRFPAGLTMLDPMPRVAIVEGLGLIGLGADKRAAVVAADIAEHTLRAVASASALERYVALTPAELFDMEYWSLEQAKIGKRKPSLLGGQVALITGAAGACGVGVARALLGEGAEVVLTDVNRSELERVRGKLAAEHGAAHVVAVSADVCDVEQVRAAFDTACRSFGGIDIVVPNAGIAVVQEIEHTDPAAFRKVIDVNLLGTLTVLKEAVRVFRAQGTGGSVVIQASKNVFAPGAGFGAYSASKAGAHQLGKIAAMEFAPLGVTVNMVNADAVFGDDDVPSGLWREVGPGRMKARGLDPEGLRAYYRNRSLLKREVRPEHIGRAVVFFASGATPTTGATLPVDAGIPGAFPR